ncbi:unnamed protein product [Sympodiomycopsis kandeliae]
MAAASTRPQLALDVNMAQTAGRNPRQNNRALMHAARSAQAPQEPDQGGFSSDEDDLMEHEQQQYDMNDSGDGDLTPRAGSRNQATAAASRNYTHTDNRRAYDDSDDEYEQHAHTHHDLDEDEFSDEEEMDGEDEEMSSSPSIPDENIDFDLVYALHAFAATVEGQATVDKGNSLTLLDDSNSYWWLVRVLKTQEVGYIPAENIETPYERLARLNKHRNVELTSATDDDHIQVPSKIYSSHLVKQRDARDRSGLSPHSGKLSALSQRRDGAPVKNSSPRPGSKPSVIFGPPSYVEHSGDEYETDDEEEYDDDEEYEEDYEQGDEEEDEDYDDDDDDVRRRHEEMHARRMAGEEPDMTDEQIRQQMEQGYGGAQTDVRSRGAADAKAQQTQAASANTAAGRKALLAGMEPDDGMDWDAADVERMQKEKLQRQQQHQQNQQHARDPSIDSQRRAPGSSWDNAPMSAQQPDAQQVGHGRPAQQQVPQRQGSGSSANSQRPTSHLRKTSSERTVSTISSSEGPLMPSEIQAGRDRNVSNASNASTISAGSTSYEKPGGPYGRGSPMPVDARRDSKGYKRKSKGSIDVGEDSMNSTGSTEDKSGKKRSGVFSGLFSRNKDKKERKSGSFSSAGGGDDSIGRSSEDIEAYKARESAAAAAAANANGGVTSPPSTGMGRTVQERDRAQQEAYSRQFLGATSNNRTSSAQDSSFTSRNHSGKPRPGSLMGTPNTVPMLNVLRIFAGDDVNSDSTFKTVLLNDSTSTRDLMRQAMQRFRLPQVAGGYVLTVKSLEGIERSLGEEERPLQVFDSLSEMDPEHTSANMPSVKRSSVGSISSVSSNLSLNPAIARANQDFGDDHAVKFYLRRRFDGRDSSAGRAGVGTGQGSLDSTFSNQQGAASYDAQPVQGLGGSTDSSASLTPVARFALRVLIFPGDLPEGTVFDPQTPALIPANVLAERGSSGLVASETVEQRYREKILSLPRNATVAEVIEGGLDRFGIAEGVVEGGDDVEDRTTRRRSKPRVKYGLTVEIRQRQERALPPNSKVLEEAFPHPPVFRAPPPSNNKRRSADSSQLLSMAEEQIRPDDPVFILRIVGGNGNAVRHNKPTVRSLSPTEGRLADRQEQRRQEELSNVRAGPSSSSSDASSLTPTTAATPRSLIAAQRAAAQERKAAVLGAQRNDQQGVDVYLVNDAKISSSRSLEGKVRYSYLPGVAGTEELDISAIVEDVLADQNASSTGQDTLRRPGVPFRDPSSTTLNSFQSAPSTPLAQSPIELSEAHIEYPGSLGVAGGSSATAPLSFGSKSVKGSTSNNSLDSSRSNKDLLEGFVRNPQTSEHSIENRIDQVLSRVAGGAAPGPAAAKGNKSSGGGVRQASGGSSTHRDQSSYGSEELSSSTLQDSPRSASTNPTPVSMMAGVGALVVGSGSTQSLRSRGGPSSTTILPPRTSGPAAYIPSDDFGLDHLYTIVDAAMRRDPKKYTRVVRPTSSGGDHPSPRQSSQTVLTLAPSQKPLRAEVAGLFPPSTRVDYKGSAVGMTKNQLDNIEDGLDRLLADVQRVL